MKFLSIDTSTQYSVIALSDEDGLVFGHSCLFEKGRSDGLPSLVSECLKKTKTKIEEIDYFAVGCGPGSFTGLRIGISVVKALSYAQGKKCLAFSSLDAVAYNEMPLKKEYVCVCVDAKRLNVYCRFYSVDRLKNLHRVSDDLLLGQEDFLKRVNSGMSLSGDALCLWSQKLPGKLKHAQLMSEKYWYPTPQSLSRLTLDAFKKGVFVDCFALDVEYLYEKDCQVNRSLKAVKKK
ncbi:MAG: tRNA (adenosine(37)-N6)-threonylcarbamoyltransferase complex dimerization subunit type 1 TsaB [Candidatus Omnitrophota bacterium]